MQEDGSIGHLLLPDGSEQGLQCERRKVEIVSTWTGIQTQCTDLYELVQDLLNW